eukprot:6859130-Pyramimonas_sp.AAC.1
MVVSPIDGRGPPLAALPGSHGARLESLDPGFGGQGHSRHIQQLVQKVNRLQILGHGRNKLDPGARQK